MKGIIICTADLIKKHIKQNIVLMIQIAVTILIFLGFIGKLQYISSKSDIAETFNSSKALYYTPFSFTSQDITAEKIIEDNSLDILEIGCVNHMYISSNDNLYLCLGYSDAIIERCNLKLSSGKWFDEYDKTDAIPIISLNNSFSLNDTLMLEDNNGKKYEAVVIGSISPDDYVIEFNHSGSKNVMSIEFFAQKPQSAFIVPYNSKKLPTVTDDFDYKRLIDDSPGFVGELLFCKEKSDNVTIEKAFSEYGEITDIDQMIENYKRDIKFDFISNGIILLVFTLLTAAGIGGINGMQSRLDRKNYIIYYMLGMNKKECAAIEFLRTFSIAAVGFFIALFLYNIPSIRKMLYSNEIIINISTFVLSFIYIILIFCIVSMKYVIDLGKGSLIDHYKNQE